MECLGLDYGERRIGLAWGNELGVASPIEAAVEATAEQRIEHIGREIQRRRIDTLVVGYPLNMDGSTGFKAKEVDRFIELLQQRFALPVERMDERLTSSQANADLQLNLRDERRLRSRGIVDSSAAALILQDWLDLNLPSADANDFDAFHADD